MIISRYWMYVSMSRDLSICNYIEMKWNLQVPHVLPVYKSGHVQLHWGLPLASRVQLVPALLHSVCGLHTAPFLEKKIKSQNSGGKKAPPDAQTKTIVLCTWIWRTWIDWDARRRSWHRFNRSFNKILNFIFKYRKLPL